MRRVFYLFFFLTSTLLADDNNPFPSGSSFSGQFIKMMITLVILLLVAFLSLIFIKKLMIKGKNIGNGNNIIILEKKALNPKSSLYLLDVCGKKIVIADSPQGVHLITEFPEGKNIEGTLEKSKTSFIPKQPEELAFGLRESSRD